MKNNEIPPWKEALDRLTKDILGGKPREDGTPPQPDAESHISFAIADLSQSLTPFYVFQNALQGLENHINPVDRRKVKIIADNKRPSGNAYAKRRSLSVLGYKIVICPQFYHVLDTAVEFFASGNIIISAEGKELQGMDISSDSYDHAVESTLKGYILGDSSFIWSAELMQNRIERIRREAYIPDRQRQDLIVNFLRDQMIFFTIAHELGHIYLGHCDRHQPTQAHDRQALEFEADGFAIELLLGRKAFFVPGFSFSMFGSQAEAHQAFWLVETLDAMTTLFGVYDLLEQAAVYLGADWDENYPKASLRLDNLRTICISKNLCLSTVFSEWTSMMSPPEEIFTNFQRLGRRILKKESARSSTLTKKAAFP